MSEAAVQDQPDTTITEQDEDTEQSPDLEAILPPGGEIEVNGIKCRVRRLKTREFLALVNVITSGLGPSLQHVTLDLSDEEALQQDLAALLLLAVPNAVDEFSMFLRAVVEPVDSDNAGKIASYLLDNPDVDDLLEIFEMVVVQEKDDLVVLAGKAQAMWRRMANLFKT